LGIRGEVLWSPVFGVQEELLSLGSFLIEELGSRSNLFWEGFGSSIGVLAIVAAVISSPCVGILSVLGEFLIRSARS
jgi:hypothetical protein